MHLLAEVASYRNCFKSHVQFSLIYFVHSDSRNSLAEIGVVEEHPVRNITQDSCVSICRRHRCNVSGTTEIKLAATILKKYDTLTRADIYQDMSMDYSPRKVNSYCCSVNCGPKWTFLLSCLDRRTRKKLIMHNTQYLKGNTERLYLPRKEGDRQRFVKQRRSHV